jgi:hypothetical protein
VIGPRVFSKLTYMIRGVAAELPAAIGRYHPVGRAVKNEEWHRQLSSIRLNPRDGGGNLSREPGCSAAVKQWIREYRLHDGGVPCQTREVHADLQGESRP